MIANLPLLFAGGNPTALPKITAAELERFITFMVTCSWGHDTAKEIKQPPWWPADVPFSHPFRRPAPAPAASPAEWAERLRQLVRRCYDFHKSKFLLVFSAQLARYPRHKLRYVDNQDHTTSLYYRPNGKLLVTFRNENMTYDAAPGAPAAKLTPEPAPETTTSSLLKTADIYLCDNCDSHFDNLDILKAHERLCNSEAAPSCSFISGGLPEFLSALKLRPANEKDESSADSNIAPKLRLSRSSAVSDRGPQYPFSSIAYMRNAKPTSQRDSTYSRERTERYCCDTPTTSSKPLGSKYKGTHFPVKYRRPIDYWHRKQVFPHQRNKLVLDLAGQLALLKCRPISVDVTPMSEQTMTEYMNKLKEEARQRAESAEDIEFVGGFDCDQVMDVEKDDPLTRAAEECEVIDLCSDDEGGSGDPRAGVTCVMRGGAVLRRAVASPPRGATPNEPSGARQAVLHPNPKPHPHPVILFTHSLSSLQTISID